MSCVMDELLSSSVGLPNENVAANAASVDRPNVSTDPFSGVQGLSSP